MYPYIVIAVFLISYGVAVPLNINLGAYSPALVVGDGEISFGGKEDVSGLMNALEGAAINGAAANGQPTQPALVASAAPTGAAVAAPDLISNQQPAKIAAIQGARKDIEPRIAPLSLNKEKPTRKDISDFEKRAIESVKARDGTVPPNMRTTVTTMIVRGGALPPGLTERSPVESLGRRTPPSSLDAVNLNMAEGQLAELTFVETRGVNGDFDDDVNTEEATKTDNKE